VCEGRGSVGSWLPLVHGGVAGVAVAEARALAGAGRQVEALHRCTGGDEASAGRVVLLVDRGQIRIVAALRVILAHHPGALRLEGRRVRQELLVLVALGWLRRRIIVVVVLATKRGHKLVRGIAPGGF